MNDLKVPTLHPEMTLHDAALTTADYVMSLEADTIRQESRDTVRWQSLPSFEDPLSFSRYIGKREPNIAFQIGGDMSDELVVYMRTADDLRLENDAYAQYFLERYLGIINGHEHDICMHILQGMLKQKEKRDELFNSLDSQVSETAASLEVAPKDSMSSDYAKGELLSWIK